MKTSKKRFSETVKEEVKQEDLWPQGYTAQNMKSRIEVARVARQIFIDHPSLQFLVEERPAIERFSRSSRWGQFCWSHQLLSRDEAVNCGIVEAGEGDEPARQSKSQYYYHHEKSGSSWHIIDLQERLSKVVQRNRAIGGENLAKQKALQQAQLRLDWPNRPPWKIPGACQGNSSSRPSSGEFSGAKPQ